MIKDLLKIPSTSGNESQIQGWIAKKLTVLDGKLSWIEKNIVYFIPGIDHSIGLIFNAHVDTVPAGSLKDWEYDPFSGKIIGGKIYGLGASDEKSAVATQLLLAEAYKKHAPACDIYLTFVVNEEVDGSGTKDVMKWFIKQKKKHYHKLAGVLGEPTNNVHIEIGHKGNIFLKVTTHGDSGHGSKPNLIHKHAVTEMMKVASKLETLSQKWKKKYKDLLLGYPTIGSLTAITAGSIESPNKFPDTCVATFDIRTTPAMHDKALNQVKKLLGKYVDVDVSYPPVPYGYTDPKSQIVSVFKKVTHAPVGVFPTGSCDMPFFTAASIPAVVFGPGDPSTCHKANEYCELKKIEECVEIYKKVIEAYVAS